jgi:uncharacterized membrane protein
LSSVVLLTALKSSWYRKTREGGDIKMAEPKGNENLMGAAAYLLGFVTGIILLLVEKQSKFVRFHAMQSTILYGGIFIVNIALGFIPILGWLAGLILSFVAFILWIMCMWKAFQGEMYKVPFVGDIAEQQLAKMK